MARSENGGKAPTEGMRREHELQTFLRQDLQEIEGEYERIFSRTAEDPGTAGDEGEENWRALLEAWLPDSYKVVTKGRVLGVDGEASSQVDVLVLKPGYPRRLLNKKVYLVHGVAAVFECKTTIRSHHVEKASATVAQLRSLADARAGTPYRELTTGPVFGLVAHSHSWKGGGSDPLGNLDRAIDTAHQSAGHPAHLLDVVCVADLASWHCSKMPFIGSIYFDDDWPLQRQRYGLPADGGPLTTYHRWHESSGQPQPNPVAVLVAQLLQRLGWEDPAIRPLADYFRLAGLWGASQGRPKPWAVSDVYSPDVAAGLQSGRLINGALWDEWSMHLP